MKRLLQTKNRLTTAKGYVDKIYSLRAKNYARFHHIFTRGKDTAWRQEAAWLAEVKDGYHVLDVGTGVGLSALEYYKVWTYQGISNIKITGIDYNKEMLEMGRANIKKAGLQDKIILLRGDATNMKPNPNPEGLACLGDNSFDVVINVLGVGGLDNPLEAFKEKLRVCKEGGRVVVLDMHNPIPQLHGGESLGRRVWNKVVVSFLLKKIWGWINPSLMIVDLEKTKIDDHQGTTWGFKTVIKVIRPEPFLGRVNSCIAIFVGEKVRL